MQIIRNRLSVLCALAFASVLPNALAADLTITSDVTNWEGLTLPAAGEEIIINDGVTATVTTRAALDAICGCARIRPMSETSRFVVEVPAGEVWTNRCSMSAVKLTGAGNKDFAKGELVKCGKGVLWLDADGHHLLAGTSTLYDWWTKLTAAEGELRLPQNENDGTHYVGYVAVSNGASFFPVESGGTYVRGLFGDGVITNASQTARSLVCMGEKSVNLDSVFRGAICGAVNLVKDKDATLLLCGTNSSFTGSFSINSGIVGIERFGRKTDVASTIGMIESLACSANKELRIIYLGTGETTDKEAFIQNQSQYRFILDGGETGGLVWQGNLRPQTGLTQMREAVFSGSGAAECVFDGLLYGNYASGAALYGGLYYAKEGSGTWRFTDHYERRAATGFAIREGTLAFDSIDEQGRLCSLGLATNLTAGAGVEPLARVDYAFTLGTTNTTQIPAVFAYTGTNSAQTSTRSIALAGDGHLRNDTARRLRLVGVKSLGAGATTKTLVLDGSGANTNEIADVVDGAAGYHTAVSKEGAGVWKMSGDLTFTGPLSVKQGTLVVKKTQPGDYKWFRWTIKEKHATDAGNPELNINSIAFLDKDVKVQSAGMLLNDHVAELEPGQFGFQTVRSRVDMEYTPGNPETLTHPNKMFVKGNNYGMWARFVSPQSSTAVEQVLGDPQTWVSLVARLPDSAHAIDSFDYCCTWGKNRKWLTVKTSSLEGSVDGLHWDVLTENVSENLTSGSWLWTVGNTSSYNDPSNPGAKVAGTTAKTYSVLTGEPVVSVATNAALVADGEMSIKHLSVNAAEGMGEINGFAFAEGGTIDFTNLSRETTLVKANFKNATDFVKVNDWSVSIDGKAKSGYKVTVSEDGIKIARPGLILSIR